MTGIIKFIIVIGCLMVGIVINGWAFIVLWKWFVAPIFGLKLLTISQGIGLSVLISFLKFKPKDYNFDYEEESVFRESIIEICIPLCCLTVGWVVHCFM